MKLVIHKEYKPPAYSNHSLPDNPHPYKVFLQIMKTCIFRWVGWGVGVCRRFYLGFSLSDKTGAQHVNGMDEERGETPTEATTHSVIDRPPLRGRQFLWQNIPHSLGEVLKGGVLKGGKDC